MSRCESLALVLCVGKKGTQPSVAKDLYQSDWFFKARRYVEQQDLDWCILSAKYGLVHRDTVIEPYEQTLKVLPADQRRRWSEDVLNQIFQDYSEVKLIRLGIKLSHNTAQLSFSTLTLKQP